MVRENVKETFERCATKYDQMIERVVPYYHDQHDIILSLLPSAHGRKLKVLDLETGTGVLGRVILQRYPNSFVHGVDLSEKMITVCSEQLKQFAGRFTLSCCDIETANYERDYDIVVAGLVIHHLADDAKRAFFKRMRKALGHEGVFILRDIVKSTSNRMNDLYKDLWRTLERSNGIDPVEIEKDSDKNDIPATLENQLAWLKEAGFREVDCVWKYDNFAIIAAYA